MEYALEVVHMIICTHNSLHQFTNAPLEFMNHSLLP